MHLLSLALVAVGAVLVAWGLVAAHRLAWPRDMAAALAALCGLAAFLVGTLLAVVPGFFG